MLSIIGPTNGVGPIMLKKSFNELDDGVQFRFRVRVHPKSVAKEKTISHQKNWLDYPLIH